jgi:hypothetical protein
MQLLASRDVQRHRTSKRELDELRTLVARDLADARVHGLSADRRFATAYNAALQTANMAVACAGYRVTAKTGHHKVTLDAVISFDNTWIEHGGVRLDAGTKLSALGEPTKQPGNVPDLTLNLAWTQQGGHI